MRDLAHAYTINSDANPDFFWVLVSRLCYYVGISAQAFMPTTAPAESFVSMSPRSV